MFAQRGRRVLAGVIVRHIFYSRITLMKQQKTKQQYNKTGSRCGSWWRVALSVEAGRKFFLSCYHICVRALKGTRYTIYY
jgi:hypothetical protein